jgi:capsular exopolysaccharide synthesis family protein
MAATNLITLTEPRSPAAEAYRTLRANLMHLDASRPVTAFLMTSAAGADDKSIAAANLAASFALAGHPTVLVDGDLRRPSQHDIWGVQNGAGFAGLLTEDRYMAELPLVPTSVTNLLLMPSGTYAGSPSDLFASRRLLEGIGVLRARAHYVIVDAPPVLAFSDAALLGAALDGAVLVVKAGATRRDHTLRARETLERVHVNVLGAVLTNAPHERAGDYR